jgi:Xaa-Pro aminopeptidase
LNVTRSGTAESIELRSDLRDAVAADRRDRLRDWMLRNDIDALVAVGPSVVNYVAGYSRYYGGPAAAILTPDREIALCVMRDEVPIAEELSDAATVEGYGQRGFGINLNPHPLLLDVVSKHRLVSGARRIGLADETGFAAGALDGGREIVGAHSVITELRRLKDETELRKLLHAYQLCWIAQRAVAEYTALGETEIEVFSAALRAAQVAHGAPIEFVGDLLSGTHTAKVCSPIYVPGARAVDDGDAVVADLVIGADGYWGDSAETHFRGDNETLAQARTKLLAILTESAAQLTPGNTGAALFRTMADRITGRFPEGEFPHHGGHAVGLTSFEPPHIIPSDEIPFESGMVIALEPGVYFPSVGGARVENVFLVTADGGVELRAAFGLGGQIT